MKPRCPGCHGRYGDALRLCGFAREFTGKGSLAKTQRTRRRTRFLATDETQMKHKIKTRNRRNQMKPRCPGCHGRYGDALRLCGFAREFTGKGSLAKTQRTRRRTRFLATDETQMKHKIKTRNRRNQMKPRCPGCHGRYGDALRLCGFAGKFTGKGSLAKTPRARRRTRFLATDETQMKHKIKG